MFEKAKERREEKMRLEKERLMALSEKELLVEILMSLKKIDAQCDDIKSKIVIWGS